MTGALARLAERATLEASETPFGFAGDAESESNPMSDRTTDALLVQFAESLPPVMAEDSLQPAIDDLVHAVDRSFDSSYTRDEESLRSDYVEDDDVESFSDWLELYVLSGDAESDDLLYDDEDYLYDHDDEPEDYWWENDYE